MCKYPREQSLEEAQAEVKRLKSRLEEANRKASGPLHPFCQILEEEVEEETSEFQHQERERGNK